MNREVAMNELRLPKYAVDALKSVTNVIRDEHGAEYSEALWNAFEQKDGDGVLRALRKALGQSKIDFSVTRWGDDFRMATKYAGDAIVNAYEMLQALNESGVGPRARTLAANAKANCKRWAKTSPSSPAYGPRAR